MKSRLPAQTALVCAVMLGLAAAPAAAQQEKLSPQERLDLVRGLTAEYATAQVLLPRSKKPLPITIHGAKDESLWAKALEDNGPAARKGDMVQITKVEIKNDEIVLEINHGIKGGARWYDRIQIGVGASTSPIRGAPRVTAPGGTEITLQFPGRIPSVSVGEVKRYLSPLLNFDQRSVTEDYVSTLPPEVRKAIEEKKPVEGMDRDQVLLAMGHPRQKLRETREGIDYEEWIYGNPPGRITFVTFQGSRVVKVRESYAGIGGSVAPDPPPAR